MKKIKRLFPLKYIIHNIQAILKSLPNNSSFSISMRQMLGSLMNSRNFFKITQDELGQANVLGNSVQISGGDRIKINIHFYDIIPEKYKALSSTSYNGITMKNDDDILMLYSIIKDSGHTGIGDESSKRKSFFYENTS